MRSVRCHVHQYIINYSTIKGRMAGNAGNASRIGVRVAPGP
jgi:hypothetical protein